MASAMLALLIIGVCGGEYVAAHTGYYGRDVGALSQLQHGVRGHVYAVDSRTLFLKEFYYDGEGPAAYFYVGKSKSPRAEGALRLRDERGGTAPLRKYRGEGVTLSLPDGLTLKDVRWFSVWCDEFAVNFGDVSIPRDLEYPRPAKVAALNGVHGVSSDPIIVVDAQTLLVSNFSYDGEAPDAKFWVGRGANPSPQGIRIPDENGKEIPLRKYDRKTIVLTLPGELTVFDIGHFGVWCEAFTVDFGHIALPRSLLTNVPPSLKMLGVSPQSKLNCEVLFEELGFEVRWAIAGESIVIQLVAKLAHREYMSFGISGIPDKSQMVGGDVVVAYIDKETLNGTAVDYYLDAKSQCTGESGACPDERLAKNTNSVRPLNVALVNGYCIVTYQRTLKAADELDLPIYTNTSQPIIWAIGPLNSENEVSYHPHYTKGDKFIEFGRAPVWNCPMPEDDEDQHQHQHQQHQHQHQHQQHQHQHQQHQHQQEPAQTPTPNRRPVQHDNSAVIKSRPVPSPQPVESASVAAWEIPAIQCYEPADGVYYAQLGPTGGKQGYPAITGHVGWGIAWYINGLLIPEINVVRGKKYTFVVEGGSDPRVPARFHPFYITNDPVGGYHHKTEEEKKGIEIYAGVRRSRAGEPHATGVGRLCEWTPDRSGPAADEFPSFGAYQRSLTLACEEGSPGLVTWTPDRNTPDTVYYQCYTHRHLGWKINVLDECDVTEAEESRVVETVALPEDLRGEESIQVHSRLTPDGKLLNQRKKLEKIINTKINHNDFSSNNDGGVTGELYRGDRNPLYRNGPEYELPISRVQIKEVIQAVENLENKMKDELKRNSTQLIQNIHQYQVHEDVREMFAPEQPIREDDEYFVEEKVPENYFLPPNQKPLTLQSVLRPNGPNNHHGKMRPPFRKPVPPEIKLRRPPQPIHTKVNTVYPLPMPNPHGPHGMKKPPTQNPSHKFSSNRPPINRPPMSSVPPMKAMPPSRSKPSFVQVSKQVPKNGPAITPQTSMSIITAHNIQGLNNVILPNQSQTLSLSQSDIIANHVVKSQIMLPGANDPTAQHSINVPQTFSKPSQIILGTPVENPVPLDQQMIQTKPQVLRTQPTPSSHSFQSSTMRMKLENELPILNDIKSSDFIGESVDSSTLQPAINTGFRPESIVVESGFKPIIREPLMAGEDKITDFGDNSNRREDTDIEEDYEEVPQYISNHAYPSDKITETFEPMFIPSPPDHILPTDDRTKEVFPSNHAKEDRPHPVYIKTEEQRNALFSKKNMEKDVSVDLVMESDRVSPHYLPPDPKLSKEHSQKLLMSGQTFTTYDGKTVSAATLTSVPDMNKSNTKFSSKLPASSELLLKTPQFGPFKGVIPPPVAAHISKHIITQTKDTSTDARDTRTTHLKLVNIHRPDRVHVPELKAEGSENRQVSTKISDFEEEDYDDIEEDEDSQRRKREAAGTFQKGEVTEQKPINGHSLPTNHVEFEIVSASTSITSQYRINIVLLMLCMKLF